MPVNHIAIVASPVPGHFDPLRVLAARLTDRGYRVTFVHMADAAPLAGDFAFATIGQRTHGPGALKRFTDILARASGPVGFMRMIRATAGITRMLLDEVPGALRRIGADAVIADMAESAAALAARRSGLPWITSATGLPLLREPSVPPPFTGFAYQDDAAGIQRNAAGYRIADLLSRPIDRLLERYAAQWGLDPRETVSPALQIAQCPPGLDFPRRALPDNFHYCGPWRDPPAAPLDLPDSDRPLVYCSLGSLQGSRRAAFAAMTQACASVGARAVVAHGGRLDDATARGLPGDPIVRAHWHQPQVLARCRAAILHGGFNTVLDALAAGVPMLIAPIAFEQPGTAARIAHIGAGKVLSKRLSARRIEDALAELLATPAYRLGAERLADEMTRLGGADRAAALVDRIFRPAPAAVAAAPTTASPGADDARDDSRQSENR